MPHFLALPVKFLLPGHMFQNLADPDSEPN